MSTSMSVSVAVPAAAAARARGGAGASSSIAGAERGGAGARWCRRAHRWVDERGGRRAAPRVAPVALGRRAAAVVACGAGAGGLGGDDLGLSPADLVRLRGLQTEAVLEDEAGSVPLCSLEPDVWAEAFGPEPITYLHAPGKRVVAIGDLHGDLYKARRALQLGGVLDLSGESWCGGDTIVVQVGDVLDRGDEELAILELFGRLHAEAQEVGGAVYLLNGNHEIMNVAGDFRYVTLGGYEEVAQVVGGEEWWDENRSFNAETGEEIPPSVESAVVLRRGLFEPGGPLARQLATNSTVLIVNDSVFVHGGLHKEHIEFGLQRLNHGVSMWMLGLREGCDDPATLPRDPELCLDVDMDVPPPPRIKPPAVAVSGSNGAVWSRTYSQEGFLNRSAAAELEETLALVQLPWGGDAKRMVVGHTPQMRGLNGGRDGKIWRVDAGMSKGILSAPAQVLEIDADGVTVRILRENEMQSFDDLADDEDDEDVGEGALAFSLGRKSRGGGSISG